MKVGDAHKLSQHNHECETTAVDVLRQLTLHWCAHCFYFHFLFEQMIIIMIYLGGKKNSKQVEGMGNWTKRLVFACVLGPFVVTSYCCIVIVTYHCTPPPTLKLKSGTSVTLCTLIRFNEGPWK